MLVWGQVFFSAFWIIFLPYVICTLNEKLMDFSCLYRCYISKIHACVVHISGVWIRYRCHYSIGLRVFRIQYDDGGVMETKMGNWRIMQVIRTIVTFIYRGSHGIYIFKSYLIAFHCLWKTRYFCNTNTYINSSIFRVYK